jgi:hypothetical protein
MSAKKWIPSNLKKGAFTAQAQNADMGTQQFANAVLSGRVKANATTKRRASLAKTFKKMAQNRKRGK